MLVTGIEGATVGATVVPIVDVVWGADVTVVSTVVVVVVVSTTVEVVVEVVDVVVEVVEVVGGSVTGTVVSGTVVEVVVVIVVDVVVSGHVVVVSGMLVGVMFNSSVYDVPYQAAGFPQQTPVLSLYDPG